MKANNVPGEFGFKAVRQWEEKGYWELSDNYFFSFEEAMKAWGPNIKWPVEVLDNGSIYVPAKEELE